MSFNKSIFEDMLHSYPVIRLSCCISRSNCCEIAKLRDSFWKDTSINKDLIKMKSGGTEDCVEEEVVFNKVET